MPASRDDLFERLKTLRIDTTTKSHAPVFTVDEARLVHGNIPGGHCKNLFCKDEKGVIWLPTPYCNFQPKSPFCWYSQSTGIS
jgi:Ala-tRNA(Pro) deacylase